MNTIPFKTILKELGQNIQRLREKQGLSQEALSEKLEVSRTYIAYIETGSRTPSLKMIHKIAHILEVKMKDLFSS